MITLTYNDKKYLLTFTRETMKTLQTSGFDLNDLRSKPNVMIPLLFRGAFLANHRDLKTKIIDDIFDNLTGRTDLIGELVGMYQECVDSLFDEPENPSGNVSWEKS